MSQLALDINADTEVRGVIERIFYHENGRVIASVTAHGYSRLTVLGDMADPRPGGEYVFVGQIAPNERYGGYQMQLSTYRSVLPETESGVVRYLVDTARFVGPSVAKALVKAYGEQTLKVLKDEPARVSQEVKGITLERAQEIAGCLRRNAALEAASIELNTLLAGVLGPATSRKALKRWGADAPHLLKRNPYRLRELAGVGFAAADRVYRKLNLPLEARKRHAHALQAAVADAVQRHGHTRLGALSTAADASKLLGGPLRSDAERACRRAGVLGGDAAEITLAELDDAERYVAGKLAMLRAAGGSPASVAISADGLAADQAAAAALAQHERVMILTGAPGTGKTYTVARIVAGYERAGLDVALCAPTGKAAKQMTLALASTCGGAAQTIHSLLEPEIDDETGEFRFARNERTPIDADAFVIDEFSMVDVRLARSLLRAIPDGARVLIVGDHYQLPSVGPGAVLRDLLQAGVPHCELTEIKRNAGLIVRACHAIKDGRAATPASKLDLEHGANWRHIACETPEQIAATVHTLLRNQLAAHVEEMAWDVQIISPTNERGPLACDKLNALARELLNPGRPTADKLPFGVGDKVVRLRNKQVAGVELCASAPVDLEDLRDLGKSDKVRVVNGDLGVVLAVDKRSVWVQFRYPDRAARLPRGEHYLKLAYAMTCHKLQGSECPIVLLPLHESLAALPLWTREWLYTAFSRAKRFLVTVGDLNALDGGLRRIGTLQRRTGLVRALCECAPAAA